MRLEPGAFIMTAYRTKKINAGALLLHADAGFLHSLS